MKNTHAFLRVLACTVCGDRSNSAPGEVCGRLEDGEPCEGYYVWIRDPEPEDACRCGSRLVQCHTIEGGREVEFRCSDCGRTAPQ